MRSRRMTPTASIPANEAAGERGPASRAATPVNSIEWHTVVLEIQGEEVVATLDDKSVTVSNPLLGAAKHSIMLGAGTRGELSQLSGVGGVAESGVGRRTSRHSRRATDQKYAPREPRWIP